MQKKTFYTEAAYVLGIIILALGTAMMERANFGVSMVVAPAYLLYLKLNPIFPFFTFGMAEYLFQLALLLVMMLVLRRARISYLFSFVTAVLYGFTLDGCMALISLVPGGSFLFRVFFFVAGMVVCCAGVSLFFHTYITTEVYELLVKEISARFSLPLYRFKTIYDCLSCLLAIIMSFCFFGLWHFEGVKLGTVLCALVNGWTISICTKFFEHFFVFRDGLKLRKLFS